MDEIQLIKGCKENKPKAQKELYETYARKMMAVCLRYTNDRESAQICCKMVSSKFLQL